MEQDLLEKKKRLIGRRSDRNQEFWLGVFLFVVGLFFIPILIGIIPVLLGSVLILWGWEAKSGIDKKLAEIDFEINKDKGSRQIEHPLDILKARYAKGEITKEQFEKMKKEISRG